MAKYIAVMVQGKFDYWWLSVPIYSPKFHLNWNISYEFWIELRLVLVNIMAIYQ